MQSSNQTVEEIMQEPEGREMFTLRDGRTILDPVYSDKLFKIKQIAPDKKSTDSSGYEWNDFGMSELFAEIYSEEARWVTERKEWYVWDGHVWRPDTGSMLINEKVKDFVRLMILYCGEILDDDRRKAYTAFVSKMGDRRMRSRIIGDAASVMTTPLGTFDANPYLINCRNGTYDLRTMTFRESDWRDFQSMETGFEYTTLTGLSYPRWEKFIDEVTEGNKAKADYLQRALGYSLLGKSNEACMFIVHGKSTRNGKSTLLGAIERMLGDYSRVAPVGLICSTGRQKDANAAAPEVVALKGRRFVTMSESNEYGKLDEEKIKQFTGGEAISGRELYQAPITFLPQFTMWLSCNDLPAVRDKSLFASDRIRVIEFNHHFTQQEQDKNLASEFDTPTARMGIFAWLLRGWEAYRQKGLDMPEEMQQVVRKYERDNDIVLQFLEENCVQGEYADWIRAKDMFQRYRMWAKGEGYRLMTTQKFSGEMERHADWGITKAIKDSYVVWRGVKWRNVV